MNILLLKTLEDNSHSSPLAKMRGGRLSFLFFNKHILFCLLFVLIQGVLFGQEKTIKDDVGNVFTLTEPPQRIVSLAPNITEILFALGLGEKVVGVTRYCDYPLAALQKAKVGGLLDPAIEKIKSLGPDLVIAFRGNPWSALKRLQALRLRVFILDIGHDLDAVPKTIEKIGRLTGREKEAQALLKILEDKYQKIISALEPVAALPKVFLNIHGMGLATCGRTSYLHDLLVRAKSVNIAGRVSKDWINYSREQLIKDEPEVIIIMTKSEPDFVKARDWFKSQAGFQSIPAVRTGRIHFLDENIASRFGPRLYDAFAELVRLIHPELFEPNPIGISPPLLRPLIGFLIFLPPVFQEKAGGRLVRCLGLTPMAFL